MDLLSIGSSPSQNGLVAPDLSFPAQGKSNSYCNSYPIFPFSKIAELLTEKKPSSAAPQVVSLVPESMDLLGSLSSSASSSG
jgi:hypothetical protein